MTNTDKTIVLISSLGGSELTRVESDGTIQNLRANPTNPNEIQFREKTKNILDDYDNQESKLSLPIQTPIIKKIKERHRKNPDHIFFIYTDQSEKPHKQDTLYAYEIIRKLLAASVSNIHGIAIDSNPSDYDNVYNDLAPMILENVGNILRQNGISEKDVTVYLNITGGTPAFTLGPTLRCIQKYDDFFTIYKPNEDTSAAILDLASDIRNQLIGEDIVAAAELYQYKVAVKLSSKLNTNDTNRNTIQAMCDYANARTNMDMEEAEMILNTKLSSSKYGMELEQLHKKYSDKYIDLYYNTAINLDKGEYVDFLSRLYTYAEVILHGQVIIHIPARLIKRNTYSREYIDRDKLELPGNELLKKALVFYFWPENKNKTIFLEWKTLVEIAKQYPDKIKGSVVDAALKFDDLKQLRNDNMHKIKGVSLSDIVGDKKPFSDEDALKDNMWKMLDGLTDIQTRENNNPYKIVNGLIKEILTDCNCIRG